MNCSLISSSTKLLFSLICSFICLHSQAQKDCISIRGKDGPLASAVVQVFTSGKTTPAFLITDQKGFACCINTKKVDSILVSHLSIQPLVLKKNSLAELDSCIQIRVNALAFQLKEVLVQASKSGIVVQGDTIFFEIDQFTDGKEQDVADILRKLPGLSLNKDGELKYNGQAIDKIILNGKDVVRSQFDLVNDLVGSREVSGVEVISALSATGETTNTLNINTSSSKSIRANGYLGSSARLEPVAKLTVLKQNDEAWQWYSSLRSDGTGQSTLTTSDALRELDFDMAAIQGQTEINPQIAFKLVEQDPIIKGQKDHLGQLNAVRSRGSQTIRLYASHRITQTEQEGEEDILNPLAGNVLGTINRQGQVSKNKSYLSAAYLDSIGKRINIKSFASLSYQTENRNTNGNTLNLLNVGQFSESHNDELLKVDLLAKIDYKLNDKLEAQLYHHNKPEQARSSLDAIDRYQIYGISSLLEQNGNYRLLTSIDRNHRQQSSQAKMKLNLETYSLSVVLDIAERFWSENLSTNPISSFSNRVDIDQKELIHSSFLQFVRQDDRDRIDIRLGWQQASFFRETKVQEKASWFGIINVNQQINPKVFLNANLSSKTIGFARELYWQNISPINGRSYRSGIALSNPLSRQQNAKVTAKYTNPARSSFAYLSVGLSQTGRGIQYLSSTENGFIRYDPIQVGDLVNRTISGNFSTKKAGLKANLGINFNRSSSRIIGNERLERQTFQPKLSMDYVCAPWLTLNGFYRYSNNQQTFSAQGGSVNFNVQTLGGAIRLRGNRLRFEIGPESQFSAGLSLLTILNASLRYKDPERSWSIEIVANDLLNYRRSTFRSISLQAGEVSLIDFERIPGFIRLGASYVFTRS